MKKLQLATLLWLVSFVSGAQTLVDVRTQTKNVDFSGAASTIPARSGPTVPATCKLGEMFFNTGNAPGQNLYLCAPANTWTVLAGGSGSTVGTVLSAATGQFAYYSSNGATVSGHTLVAGDIPPLSYQPLLTFTGSGSKTATSTGTVAANNCAKWDANGNIIDAGVPCGSGGGSGSSAFPSLTGGTNTSAALVIGSGASLSATGTGVIAATSVPASGVTGLAPSATTDTTNASNISNGTLSPARVPATGTGTKFASSTGTVATNNCAKWDANGNIIDAGAPCGSGGGSGSSAFPSLTGGTNTSAALVIGSGAALSATGTGVIAATSVPASGVTGLAPSATTDTTNASNISSGTLSPARIPATGSGTKFATTSAAGGVNNCAKWDANGNIVDTGIPCSNGNFPSLGGGTNTGAAFIVGSGASLSATGTGTIAATSVPASGITGAIAAASAQVLTSSTHVAFGDSITAGFLSNGSSGTTLSLAYDSLLATDEKAALQPLLSLTGQYSGSQACDVSFNQVSTHYPSGSDNNSIYTLMVGTNDANVKGVGGVTNYGPNVFQPCHQAALAWIAVANKISADPSHCTDTGAWAANTGYSYNGEKSSTNGSTKSCPITTNGGPIYFWYTSADQLTGTFTYSVDGGSATTVSTQSSPLINTQNAGSASFGVMLVRIPVAPGTHTVLFTVTSPTSANNLVSIQALGTPPSQLTYGAPRVYVGGVPKQQNNANSAFTSQYDSYVQTDVALLQGDGLGVYYVPVRNYLCAQIISGSCANSSGTLDMNTLAVDSAGLHPNSVGQNDLKQAFESVEQFTPYPAAILSYLSPSNNLSDLVNTATARANLGLGSAAIQPASAFQAPLTFTGTATKTVSSSAAGVSGNCVKWLATGDIGDAGAACGSGGNGMVYPAAGVPNSTGAAWGASYSVGTAASNLVQLNSSAQLPAVSGVNLTGIASSQVSGLAPSATTDTTNAANISTGTLADSRLASDQCVIGAYQIGGATVAGLTPSGAGPFAATYTLPSLTLGSNQRICFLEIRPTVAFTGTGITAATVRIQSANGLYYSIAQDIFGTNGAFGSTSNNYWTDSGSLADRSNASVQLAFNFTGANNTNVVPAAAMTIDVGIRTVP